MGNKKQFTELEIKDMIKMYTEDFESTKNIGLKYGVDREVIINRLKMNNVKIPKSSPYSEKYWLDRGLPEDKILEHIKTLRPVNKEHWIKKGYSESEAILQIEGQKLVSLRGCIARFGEIEGKQIWDSRMEKRSENGKLGSANLEYWLNKGYSNEEAVKLRSERQNTFSLEKCLKKHGEENGRKIFVQRQNNWQKSLYKNGKLKSGYSEVSQELFLKLIENIEVNELNYFLFAKKGGEFVLNNSNGFYRYDFTDLKNKKIIEYNGDVYHANPEIYNETDTPNPFRKYLSAQEIWEKDGNKKNIANEHGFELLVVWDSEYKKNKESVINKCKNFLNLTG
jgi:hypothetical protein